MTFFIVWTEYGEDIEGIYEKKEKAIEMVREEWKKYAGWFDPSFYAYVTQNEFEDGGKVEGKKVVVVPPKKP